MPDPTDQMDIQPGVRPLGPGSDRIRAILSQHNYELLGELGRGGMGVVYLAQHRKLGRRVAIKTLAPDRVGKENSVKRFEREARTFAAIRHPHIANLYEFEDQGPLHFLALEYVEGTDLEKERRRGRKWTPEEVAKVMASVGDALDHTHQAGILHRDIKPGNILIERNTNRVVLTDFGLAKGQLDDTLTATGFAVGTPAYMSPEQITDQYGGKPDGRSDLFSLGTVAYEMLTGKHPFLANDDLNTMRNIVNGKLEPMRNVDASIPAGLASIIERLLERDPAKRLADAKELVRLVNEWLKDPNGARRNPAPKPDFSPATPAVAKVPSDLGSNAPRAAAPAPAPTPAPAGMSRGTIIAIIVVCSLLTLVLGVVVGVFLLS